METNDEKKKKFQGLPSVTIGLNMAVGMALFTYGGYYLDQKFGGDTYVILGIILGLLYCGYEIWKVIRNQ